MFYVLFSNLIYFYEVLVGLVHCCWVLMPSISCGKRGPLFIPVLRPLTIVASLVAEHRLQTRRLSSCGARA